MESSHVDRHPISGRCHVVAIPYPGRGNINPMLNVGNLLAAKGLLVTVVVTEEWLGLLGSSPPAPANLRLRSIPNVIPPDRTRGTDLRGFIETVMTKMEAPVEQLLERLEPPADTIITDALLAWAAEIAWRRGIPVSMLWTQSASVFMALYQLSNLDAGQQSSPDDFSGKGNEYMNYIPKNPSSHLDGPSISSNKTILSGFIQQVSWYTKAQSLLFSSFYDLESHAIDTIRSKIQVPIYPIGPPMPSMELKSAPTTSYYYKWLDSQPRSSVLYVAFGSFLPISSVQMDEMMMGLQASGVRFLLVTRGQPHSMQEFSADRGLVVPWCDQSSVLCHSSIGGFLTHCGWNSTLEGVFAGVPMLTLPLFWDQYPDSKLIVDDWEVGVRLRNQEGEESVVGREEIAKIVQKFMDLDADESKELRKRARELKEASRKAVEEGGSSSTNLDAFIQDVVKCQRVTI